MVGFVDRTPTAFVNCKTRFKMRCETRVFIKLIHDSALNYRFSREEQHIPNDSRVFKHVSEWFEIPAPVRVCYLHTPIVSQNVVYAKRMLTKTSGFTQRGSKISLSNTRFRIYFFFFHRSKSVPNRRCFPCTTA